MAKDDEEEAGNAASAPPISFEPLSFPSLDEKSAIGEATSIDSAPGSSLEAPLSLPPPDDTRDERSETRLRAGMEKYQPVRVLGRGGMGSVFLVHDRDLNRVVALKMVRDDVTGQESRFVEEAQIMGQLQHPNILPIHELGVTRYRKLFYTMPVVAGQTLHAILNGLRVGDPATVRTYSLTRLVQIFLAVAQAIGYAHSRRVVHRDLKPANVMVGEQGEVQVLDWGLAKILAAPAPARGAAGGSGDARQETKEGRVVGTPRYMAPEQARAESVDVRADVYALGVILYEMLTLAVPFDGTPQELLVAHVTKAPTPPRERAPARTIPLELEGICLKALRKRREDRHESARALHDEVQSWLESESDRERRHERAEQWARVGREKLRQLRALEQEVTSLEAEVAELASSFRPWQPVAEKASLYAAEDRAHAVRAGVVEVSSQVVTVLGSALTYEAGHAEARALLAEYYWDRFREAEATGDAHRRFFENLVRTYHDGRYERELQGDGTVALLADHDKTEVWLHDLVEQELVLVPQNARLLGTTPLRPVPIPMGSYLVVLKRAGFPDVRYPVHVSRCRRVEGDVRLPRAQDIGPGYVYVPAGPFLQGGDAEVRGFCLPRAEPDVPGFFLGRFPVTVAEYLEFLEDLARRSETEALRRAPRSAPDGGTHAVRGAGGRFELPDVDPSTPVVSVSWHDAVAYCEWCSDREGREVRLPSEVEWEKAARGVDGRGFPWGDRFDASLCNMRDSHPREAYLLPVDTFPSDVSIYGVRGMAGNARDWTASVAEERGVGSSTPGEATLSEKDDARSRVIRGGAWNLPANISRAANRFWLAPRFVLAYTGFRVAVSAEE